MNMSKSFGRVLSGVQPTGRIHLGNYLGAIRPWTQLQSTYTQAGADFRQLLFCVVDLHALTSTLPAEPSVRECSIDTAAHFLACGLDPNHCLLFAQSAVSAHTELAWVLSCCATMSSLKRMTQFKTKVGSEANRATVGLFSYPILMAADILLYGAQTVPVGDDQTQHIELARTLAHSFTTKFPGDAEILVTPEASVSRFARVMSLRDASRKMSKSDTSDWSRVHLTDSDDEICAKIRKAKTDSISAITFEPSKRAEVANLVHIFAELNEQTPAQVCENFEAKDTAAFKRELADLCVASIAPIRDQVLRLRADPQYVVGVLDDGAFHARQIADKTLAAVKERVGLFHTPMMNSNTMSSISRESTLNH